MKRVVKLGAVTVKRSVYIRRLLAGTHFNRTVQEIATKAGVSYPAVSAIVNADAKKGVHYELPNQRTSSKVKVQAVRTLAGAGLTLTQIAKQLGVSPSSASYTLRKAKVTLKVDGRRKAA